MSPANVYNSKTELGDSALKNCEMMHIHGTIKNRDSLVFDLPSYFKNYNDTQLKSFLASVFSDNTILFIGYGLAEFEILEFLFNQKQGESTQSKFLLNGYYSSDSDYYELEQSYYESMRITVIPFCFDERGYDQLGEVVKRWVSILHRVTTSLAVSVREIDEAISEPEPDFLKIFLMLEYKATARKYLFAKLFNAPYPFVWFDELETREYFDPNGMPEPTKNDEGETIIEEWEVIGYLINCTQKNIEIKDESSWERIVKVIDEAINHITTTHLDNYKTDSGMVELIFYLPFSKIKSDWIAYIEYSLNTKSDNTLLSNKLTHGLEKVLLSQHENAKAFLLKVIKLLLQPSQKWMKIVIPIIILEWIAMHLNNFFRNTRSSYQKYLRKMV
ncbi:MAG: SIR2 family protein [Ignavibacteriales bacterium]|nr:SIR2 family protein [Ignavibacteriales bacterium]